jgi:predicted transposase YdaD
MAILRELPWYNQILQEGLSKGMQQGLERGRLDGQRQDILYLLRARFDPPESRSIAITKCLNAITDTDRLRDLLVEAAQAPSLEAFEQHLGLTHEVMV